MGGVGVEVGACNGGALPYTRAYRTYGHQVGSGCYRRLGAAGNRSGGTGCIAGHIACYVAGKDFTALERNTGIVDVANIHLVNIETHLAMVGSTRGGLGREPQLFQRLVAGSIQRIYKERLSGRRTERDLRVCIVGILVDRQVMGQGGGRRRYRLHRCSVDGYAERRRSAVGVFE